MNEKLAELLLPQIEQTTEYYENLYPARNLPEGARVTRIAPSPTGFLHLGTLYVAMIDRKVATDTKGVFYMRIEDTDKKREVAGGIENLISGFSEFGINIDEGYTSTGSQGEYGPYRQSERAEIYGAYVKKLICEGKAYPCFCSEKTMAKTAEGQKAKKEKTGYYGKYRTCRELSFEEIKQKIDNKESYIIRLKSEGNEENKVFVDDIIKGKLEIPQNDEDIVILKSDFIPTYHFAHAVDDHLMHTTHVLRGDEWVSSLAKHIELFKTLGFKVPKYAHIAPIMTEENGNKRKLSKRKDPQAAVHYFLEQGYPPECVTEYLYTIASSEFENWRRANQTESLDKFNLNLKKMSVSGALFDNDKLNDVSKNIISKMSADEVLEKLTAWVKTYNSEYFELLTKDQAFTKEIFSIDRDVPKPRKDIAKWDEAEAFSAFFFDELFTSQYNLPEHIKSKSAVELLSEYLPNYDENDDNQQWFQKVKDICPNVGFCPDMKEYKANPENYKGSVSDAGTIIRVAITGRQNSPDLCQIMKLLGKQKVNDRINKAINFYKGGK